MPCEPAYMAWLMWQIEQAREQRRELRRYLPGVHAELVLENLTPYLKALQTELRRQRRELQDEIEDKATGGAYPACVYPGIC